MWDDYGDWLHHKYFIGRKNYKMLLNELLNSQFIFVLERDANRMEDGAYLRDQYFMENGISGSFLDRPISILEVLLALAIRIDNEYVGSPNDPRPDMIFWEFLSNLRLTEYQDSRFNVRKIHEILDFWMYRRYKYDGNGGIFPLKNPKNDQKKVELWDQTMAYLTENYI